MLWSYRIMMIYLTLAVLMAIIFAIDSVVEKEKRATKIGFLLIGSILFIWLLGWSIQSNSAIEPFNPLFWIFDALCTAGGILLLLPLGGNPGAKRGTAYYRVGAVQRFDERSSMFARIYLTPGSPEYSEYFALYPDQKEEDDERRAMGGILGEIGKIDRNHQMNIAMIQALDQFPQVLGQENIVKPHPVGPPAEIAPTDLTAKVKGLAKALGADLVGVAQLDPAWVYAKRGRIHYDDWENWGREISCNHSFAIVIATEMGRSMIMSAPHTPVTIESCRNYSEGAYITIQLADFLTGLGYEATANHSSHYEVLCVPLAVDAGLGELGRNGYLITQEFGPRVRLAVVTTNAPLISDHPVDIGVQHFCRYCKKCADLCPSRSIPDGDKTTHNGLRRWKLDEVSCSSWWAKVGTDCAICMAVCPWSHPKTLIHRISTVLAIRSSVARRILIWADDLVYGHYKGGWYGEKWCDYRVREKSANM